MKVVAANQHESKIRIRDRSPERILLNVGSDLDVVIVNYADGSATVSMHHGKQIVEKTFYPLAVPA
jgi:hypothetical protein